MSVAVVSRAAALLAALFSTGCSVRIDYGGTEFSCADPPHECPRGYDCVGGVCRDDVPPLDASPRVDAARLDAAPVVDAARVDAVATCDPAVTVDGALDEPTWADGWVPVAKLVYGTVDGASADVTARWSPSHLIVAWRVTDASLFNDSVNPWQDDSVELYFDMSYDRATSYGPDDFQFVLGWADAAIWEQSDRTTGVLHAQVTGGGGFTAEIALPWTVLAVEPAVGTVFGFDAGHNVDQDGGDLDGQRMWAGTVDNWTDTSAFGTATLADDCAVSLAP